MSVRSALLTRHRHRTHPTSVRPFPRCETRRGVRKFLGSRRRCLEKLVASCAQSSQECRAQSSRRRSRTGAKVPAVSPLLSGRYAAPSTGERSSTDVDTCGQKLLVELVET